MENLVVRTAGDPRALANAVRHAVFLEAPNLPLDEAQSLEERTAYLTDAPKRAMWLLGVFAALALFLAAAGIYGVSAYLAGQRGREIAIRMALGAKFGDIAALVYRSVLLPSAIGLAAGAVALIGLNHSLHSWIAGVAAMNPASLAEAGLTLVTAAVLAATGPALRAASSDPARVLRRE